jgi:translation initiation factor 1
MIRISTAKRRFGKYVTLVAGLEEASLKETTKQLKRALACGGTFKNGVIELQGTHAERVKEVLIKLGFKPEQIEIS